MKKIFVLFAVLAAMALMISCGGGGKNNPKNEEGRNSENSSEDDDSYAETEPTDPKEIRVSKCTGLPEHAQWNTVSEIKQSWDGRSWQPPKEGSYNETPSETECRFECVAEYHWDGSACIVDCDPDSLPTLPECSESSGTPCEDSSTHLIWSNGKSLTQQDALSYCEGLWEEGGVCGGWRLPTISELRTLIIRCESTMPEGSCAVKYPDCLSEEECLCDDCCCEETGGGFFSKLGDSGSYWSSNQCSSDPNCGNGNFNGHYCDRSWGVDFFNAGVRCLNEYGRVSTGDGTDGKYDIWEATHGARCVRKTGILWCQPSRTCEDPSTGLIWSARVVSREFWQDAVNYCTSLNSSNYGGYSSGWHLPTIDELRTLLIADRVKNNCQVSETNGCLSSSCWTCSTCTQTGTQSSSGSDCSEGSASYSDGRYNKFGENGWFWSSSTLSDYTDYAWIVNFNYGSVSDHYIHSTDSSNSVRCVR